MYCKGWAIHTILSRLRMHNHDCCIRSSHTLDCNNVHAVRSLNILLSTMLEQQSHMPRYKAQGTRQTRSHTDTTPYRPLFRYVTHGQLVKIGWLLVMVVASLSLYSSMSMSVLHNILAGTTCTSSELVLLAHS